MICIDYEKNIYVDEKPRILSLDTGEVVFFHRKQPRWLKTSMTGEWIINQLLVKPMTPQEVVTLVTSYYSIPKQLVMASVYQLIRSLILMRFARQEGMNEKGPDSQTSESGNIDLWISINSDCTLSCPNCLHRKHINRFIPYSRFKQIIDKVTRIGVSNIYITGGEPLLHPELKDMLLYLKEVQAGNVVLVTHSPGSYHDQLQKTVDEILLYIDPDMYTQYEAHLQGLSDMIIDDPDGHFNIAYVPSHTNIEKMNLLMQVADRLGGCNVGLCDAHIAGSHTGMFWGVQSGSSDFNDIFKKVITTYKHLVYYHTQSRKKGWTHSSKKEGHIGYLSTFDPVYWLFQEKSGGYCEAGKRRLYIDENYYVYPCASLYQREDCCLGNIITSDIQVLYSRALAWREHWMEQINEICKDCIYFQFCGGGCRAYSTNNRPDFRCELIRRQFQEFFKSVRRIDIYET